VEVRVPVPIGCKVPPELLAPLEFPLPEFVPACGPASSALLPEGEEALQRLLWSHKKRVDAWEIWADECGRKGDE
jgi:hypothetical protein